MTKSKAARKKTGRPRGRPRKHEARTASGRISRAKAVPASPYAMAKREFLAGAGDPNMTSNVLDLLATRGHLSDEQRRAGHRYARLRHALYGRPGGSAAGGKPDAGQLTDAQVKRYKAELAKLDARLRGEGRRARTAVDNVAVYDRTPGWFLALLGKRAIRPADAEDRRALLSGLSCLALALGYISRRDRAA